MFETVVVEMENKNCKMSQVSEVLVITTLFIRKQGYKIMKTITYFYFVAESLFQLGLWKNVFFYH